MRRSLAPLIVVASVLVAACSPGGATTPTATPSATAPPAATGTPSAPAPTSTPTGEPGTPLGALGDLIASLDPAPRGTEPDREASIPAMPVSSFPEHDRESTVLYDTETGELLDLGPGEWGRFSPDGRYMVWAAGSPATTLRVLDLVTREDRELGPARWVSDFVDDRTVDVFLPGTSNVRELVNIETGERTAAPSRPDRAPEAAGHLELEASLLRSGDDPWPPALFTLRDTRSGAVVAEFEATLATFAGPDGLLVGTPWTGESVNLYLVDLQGVQASFLATVRLDQVPVMPLAATNEAIAWTENYCRYPEPQGVTWYYERATGELVRLDRALWVGLTPDGRLTDGSFGALSILDRQSLAYEVVLPDGTVDISWSPDYRYASRGFQWGHGGVCPP